MADFIIRTDNLTVGYDGRPVTRDISLELNKGQILTLIGSNGSGKSTILKSLCGQLEAIEGVVFLEGEKLEDKKLNDIARTMAVVLTDGRPSEPLTCFDVVSLGRYPYTDFLGRLSDEDMAIIKESMELCHVLELMDKDFSKISDGQRQRVLLARAICQRPAVMILDEPTTFLDVKYRLEFLSTLMKLARERQFAVIMSLHELDMAYQISDKILCIKDEAVFRAGSPDEIFTKGFINELFDIESGSYDEATLSAILER